MEKIIACIDGSAMADRVCELAAWAAKRTDTPIALLHVVAAHAEHADGGDLSGTIGVDANSQLLAQLTELDEARGKLEQRKGRLILEHAAEQLRADGVAPLETLHRRGALVDTVVELESQAALIVIGKQGEHADTAPGHLGANLERVARAVHKPLLVASRDALPINRFLIAYDGGSSTQKAVAYAAQSQLLHGLDCHLLQVGEHHGDGPTLHEAAAMLTGAGYTVQTAQEHGRHVDEIVAAYCVAQGINLLVIGAYGHARLRSLILGSTTTALLRASTIPLLLFR